MRKFTTNDEIENLCEAMIKDFMKCKHYTNSHCVDIEAFVTEYLGISIVYDNIVEPDIGKIGFFSEGERSIRVRHGKQISDVFFPSNTAVIDKYLQKPEEIGRKRFVIAHEGAHCVLKKHIPLQISVASGFYSDYDGEIKYSPEMRKEMMSVSEMLTNRTGACLLMPRFLVCRVLKRYNEGNKILAYDGYVMAQEQKLLIQQMADTMGVNYSACLTRLKELNLFDIHPITEYLTTFKTGGVEQ